MNNKKYQSENYLMWKKGSYKIFGFLWASANSHTHVSLTDFPMSHILDVLRRQLISAFEINRISWETNSASPTYISDFLHKIRHD